MKILKRRQSRRNHTGKREETFVFHVGTLSPWPPFHGPLIVRWKRGAKRQGESKPVEPETEEPDRPTSYSFDTRFEIPATLYGIPDGTYEPKVVEFSILQLDRKGKAGNLVGVIEVNLAECLGSLSGKQAQQEFLVDCSQSVVELSGDRPRLVMGLSIVTDGENVSESLPAIPSTLSSMTEEMGTSMRSQSSQTLNQYLDYSMNSPQRKENPGNGFGKLQESQEDEKTPGTQQTVTSILSDQYDSDGFLIDDTVGKQSAENDHRNSPRTVGVRRSLEREMKEEGRLEDGERHPDKTALEKVSIDTSPFQAMRQKYVYFSIIWHCTVECVYA